jgi:hypothetical protein
MTVLAYRPKSSLTIDFLLATIKMLLRERGRPIVIKPNLTVWKKDRVAWSYLSDGSIRFELEEVKPHE